MDLISLTEMETSLGKGRDHSLLLSGMGPEDISLTMKSFYNPSISSLKFSRTPGPLAVISRGSPVLNFITKF